MTSCEETLPQILVPATQEQDTFFLTSTQVESSDGTMSDNTENNEVTPKKGTKTVESRRNKREHPPSSPLVASPVRKIEKRGSSAEVNTSLGRVTRKMAKDSPNMINLQVSVEPLPKRVPKPTEKAKAVVENVKRKISSKVPTVETTATSPKSPQRQNRALESHKTPTTSGAANTKNTRSSNKKAPEIIPETPPSATRTKATKKVTGSPDVIPGSPIGLIGLRSLTKKNLRSRNPLKK